jgi:hypothetical protein
MNGAPFQKHQGSGRRAKRLRSNGHRISCSGPAPYVAAAGLGTYETPINEILGSMEDANLVKSFRNATKLPHQIKTSILAFKPLTLDRTMGLDN